MERNNSRGYAALLAVIPTAIALTACGGAVSAPSNNPPGGTPSSLSITTATTLPGGQAQSSYQTSLTATGGVSPYTWSISAGSLPAGITLDASTGQISGTPTVEGQFSFTVQAADSSQPTPQTANKALDLDIAPPAQLQITTNALTTARIGVAYQATMTATGGVTPYTWRLAAGLLPLGLMLGATSGDITGTPTEAGQFSITIEVQDSSQPSPQVTTAGFDLSVVQGSLDLYGGSVDKQCTGGATGHFYTELINSRWWLCTPEGNVFWMRSVYGVNNFDGGAAYKNALTQKYGTGSGFPWWPFVEQTVKRMRSWGFNTIGEFAASYAYPVRTYGRARGNREKMPFIRLIRPSSYSVTNRWGWANGKVKDIVSGTDSAIYTGWRGGILADFFDPNFEMNAISNALEVKTSKYQPMFTDGLTNVPWLIGTTTDDADELFGFKRVGDPHLGWLVAVTAPTQASSTKFGSYADPIVYSKVAWRDSLITKYGDIATLNAAWGSTYTTFDSDGGWPLGQGLMDESGRNPWIGTTWRNLSGAAPQAAVDMANFTEVLAEKYFSVVAAAIKQATPNHLVFGPATLHQSKPEILRAASRHIDVLQVFVSQGRMSQLETIIQEVYQDFSGPIFFWTTQQAQADSPLAGNPGWTDYNWPTQEERGQAYTSYVNRLLQFSASDGVNPVVGIDWWAWVDKVVGGEKTNFGLVSIRDNSYDGKEAVVAPGTDAWGYPTGGEAADYGDFLTPVRDINLRVYQILLAPPTP